MGTITVYRSDDASAPVLSGQVGALIGVLDACLVDGYGAKAAAGWAKAYADTNLAAYRAAAGNRFYLRLDDTNAQYPVVRGYRAMTGISTGTGEFPSVAQLSGGLRPVKANAAGTTARPWLVIASDRAFYLWVGFNLTTHNAPSSAAVDVTFFGDIASYVTGDAMHTLIVGRTSAATTTSATTVGENLSNVDYATGHYLASDYLQTGNSIVCGVYQSPIAHSQAAGTDGPLYPDPISGGLLIDRMRIWESGQLMRGHYPGLFNPLHDQPGNHLDTLQGRGAMAGTDLLLVYKGGANLGRFAFSLNESDWLGGL